MRQIILKKDQNMLIPILLDSVIARNTSFLSTSSVTKQSKFLNPDYAKASTGNQVENVEVRDRHASLAMTENRLDIILAGENASVEIVGLLMAKGERQTALEVYITHAAPNTKSNVNVRAVLKDRSTFAFRGNVKIEKGAKGADAYLRSDALLFDDAKMGDDTPALEILEPDVKAGHAATIGKVDEAMLFYLMSRGISRKQAEKLLIDGFTRPILKKLRKPARFYLSP